MDDLFRAFREMTNRLRSILSKAKAITEIIGMGYFPWSADSPGKFADGLVFPDLGGGKSSKSY